MVVDERRDLVHSGVKGDPAGLRTLALERSSGVLRAVGSIDVTASVAYLTLAKEGRLLLGRPTVVATVLSGQ